MPDDALTDGRFDVLSSEARHLVAEQTGAHRRMAERASDLLRLGMLIVGLVITALSIVPAWLAPAALPTLTTALFVASVLFIFVSMFSAVWTTRVRDFKIGLRAQDISKAIDIGAPADDVVASTAHAYTQAFMDNDSPLASVRRWLTAAQTCLIAGLAGPISTMVTLMYWGAT